MPQREPRLSQPSPGQAAHCHCWQDFDTLKQSPLSAALADAGASVFETTGWLENLARNCPAAGQLQLLGIDSPSAPSLLALRQWPDGRLESLSNYYAALFGPVANRTDDALEHAGAYAAWIASRGAPTVRLHPLAADSAFWQRFSQELRQQGYWVDRYYAFGNWLEPTQGVSWAQYLAQRPSRLRHTIQRVRKKLLATPGFRGEIIDARSGSAELEQAIQDFCTVYANSWKRPEPYPDFVPGLCHLACSQGWLRLGLCYLDERPVAAQIWLVRAGTASIFKLAYDQRYARHGVGTWLSAAMTEHVLDVDGAAEIDFLAGDDDYKSEWMSLRRERHGLIAFNPRTPLGLLGATRHFGAGLVRRLIPATRQTSTAENPRSKSTFLGKG